MPVAFAACGIMFAPTRCQLETFTRMPFVMALLAEVRAPRPGS